MKYVQINSFHNGSTGSVMKRIHERLLEGGHESYMFWGRGGESISDCEVRCASDGGIYFHGAMCRLFGGAGFYSKGDTRKLLRHLDRIDPDVVHLHNIHGYYVNVEMLFEWLKTHRCQVKWTLHDCWSFTGHCAHFTYVHCSQWRKHCAEEDACPQLAEYPKTLAGSRSSWRDFARKKACFTSLPDEKMTLITPSAWLAGLVKQSYMQKYAVEVQNNEVDSRVFKPTDCDFRKSHNLEGKYIVLGVAAPWTERKGLDDFLRLAEELDDSFAIVMVGLSRDQLRKLPERVIGLERTSSKEELAGLYTSADLFFNPTKEDNYPTVNLEAIACGTQVVTYDVGGCSETLIDGRSIAVSGFASAVDSIKQIAASKFEVREE